MSIYDKASLVLIPSGTKTSKVYSQVPTNGDGDFTFSRSTAATRVNASGNIEKETQNFFLQSNQFDTTWYSSGVSRTSGQSGYDGTNDAWLISRGGPYNYMAQNITTSGVQSYSIYAKAGTLDWIYIDTQNSALVYSGAFFNLSSGSVGSIGSGIIDTKIEAAGNGYYRCTIVFNESLNRVLIYPVPSDGGIGEVGSGSIYIQDAQLEQGLVARDYIETTTTAIYGGITDNVPRLDYQGSCPALLLEPQRRNILPHSEWFGDYNTLNGASITSNYSESPEGYQNATRLQLNAQSLSRIEYAVTTGSPVQNERHSVSCWVKSNGGDTDFRLKCTHAGVLDYYSSNLTATSEWQRFTFTQLFGAGGGTTITAGILNGSSNNAADLSIYGLQLEDDGAGNGSSYATSYIPTYGSAVTRNAEDLDTTYANAFATNGSVTCYFELDAAPNTNTNTTSPNLAQYFTSGDYITYNHNGAGRHRIRIWANSTSSYITGGASQDEAAKIAVTATSTSASIFINGSLIESVTIDADWSSANQFNTLLSEAIGVIPLKQYMLFPTALTDQEAIDLTTI